MNSFQNNFVKVIDYSKNIENYDQQQLYTSIVDLRNMHGEMLGGFYKNLGNDLNNQDTKVELSFLDSMIDTTRKVLQLAESKFNYNDANSTNLNNMKGGSNQDNDEVEDEKPIKKVSKYEDFKKMPILFVFTAEWCGHCHHFLPTYAKLKHEYVDDSKLKTINIDEANNRELVERYKVDGFPSIKLFDGKKLHEFNGGRDINNIRDFVNKILKCNAIKD
jgi:thiol-disulfide isomerase/thioredoxin